VKIVASNRGAGTWDIGFSVPELDDLRTRAGVFEQVAAMLSGGTNLTGAEHPQRLEIAAVSANYFSMLGSAHIGRVFGPGDEVPGYGEAIAISDSLWARGFGRLRLGVASSYPFSKRTHKTFEDTASSRGVALLCHARRSNRYNSNNSRRMLESLPCGLVVGKSLRCIAIIVDNFLKPYNGR
jgi:hypothetical protein